jgi:hypothetical protein
MSILKLKTSAIIARERTLSLPCPALATQASPCVMCECVPGQRPPLQPHSYRSRHGDLRAEAVHIGSPGFSGLRYPDASQ